MRDPHVVALYYRMLTDESVSFTDPPPVEWETAAFRVRLQDGVARFELIEHYRSAEAARERVEPSVQAWEVDAALGYGRREIRFNYERAEVIDRDPPEGWVSATATINIEAVVAARAQVARPRYPDPPHQFAVSPDVETLWNRYEGYLQGREPLLSAANACLTWLEAAHGGRRNVARKFRIREDALGKLGQLAAERGDERTARKFRPGRPPRPLDGSEQAWIETAIKAVIRRLGEYAADPQASWPEITMASLPPL